MREFRVGSGKAIRSDQERTIRIMMWGGVAALSGIIFFAIFRGDSSSPQLNRALAWAAGLIAVSMILGAYVLAARAGMERLRRSLVLVLSDGGLVCRRSGLPDVGIVFSEIKALYERPGRLVVTAIEPERMIIIPVKIDGFASIRAELVKHHPITAAPKPSPLSFVATLAWCLCWALMLSSSDTNIIRVSGALGLILLAWMCLQVGRRLRHIGRPQFLWLVLGLNWAAGALVVCFRIWRR